MNLSEYENFQRNKKEHSNLVEVIRTINIGFQYLRDDCRTIGDNETEKLCGSYMDDTGIRYYSLEDHKKNFSEYESEYQEHGSDSSMKEYNDYVDDCLNRADFLNTEAERIDKLVKAEKQKKVEAIPKPFRRFFGRK